MAPATGMFSRGPGRDGTRSASDQRGKHGATARRVRRAVLALLALLVAVGLSFTLSAMAAPITIVDDGGPDDEVGQKDLSQLTVDSAADPLAVSWNWDDTAWSGGNTGDACALFDTNGNGFADNVVCVGVGGDPATQQYVNLWDCSDKRADRCTAPNTGHTLQPIRHSPLRSFRTPIRSGTTLRIPPLTARRRVLRPAPTA